MSDFLLFQLYGAMAAWGDIAVGEQRPTTSHPSKSAVLGLLAAAQGIRRDEDDKQAALAQDYGFAVRVDSTGVMLRDYHTSQVPKNTKKLKYFHSRRDELAHKAALGTVLSSRDYRCDGFYTVCLWHKNTSTSSLSSLQAALEKPRFTLYLGRKSCPLALPLRAHIIAAQSIEQALQTFDKNREDGLLDFERETGLNVMRVSPPELYWEDTDLAHTPPLHTTPRNDRPLSRRRWEFGKRNEHYAALKGE